MSTNIKKIKGFTLQEMLVVLLLTALVVGMAFSVLRLVQVQMNGISSNYTKSTEMRLLKQSLWVDFNQHDRVWYDQGNKELLLANEMDEARYQFQKDMVVKERDTFFVEIKELRPYFNGNGILGGEMDALDLYTGASQSGRLFVFKRNSATSYINR
ncbi:prepilin-type N-terminal cleavage/methylation domain-containing protein [Muricauda sp. NFXS6]|uniref:prepilin-type N-terminal cleavage/methylation domain-containing protein n=1 Tax=Allomuricauda sp. NFXS6 TaxID=2819094 RepID=UPI0032DE639A